MTEDSTERTAMKNLAFVEAPFYGGGAGTTCILVNPALIIPMDDCLATTISVLLIF